MLYKFGVFEFDDATGGELRKNGRAVALEPQPAKALALLLARAGDVVSREELRHAVWGADTYVDFDRGLAYCLSQIRTALGDSGENPRFVQTIPRRGFRFVAPVAPPPAAATIKTPGYRVAIPLIVFGLAFGAFVAIWLLDPPEPEDVVHVAVSVFDNETGQPEYDRMVAGLSDLVVEHLTRIDP